MKVPLHFRGFNIRPAWRYLVEYHLESLTDLVTISKAEVVLERQRPTRSPYRLQVALAIPGPDIHASASDQTFQAALLKVVKKARTQILGRVAKRRARNRTQVQFGFNPGALPRATRTSEL